ncbi:hypothetical protein FB45DRAFT_900229 [Roridomyces roridus]|uniref:Golgi apparatus membrane protein TVP38 n=1 Tax=Roridomyces roridus TaxID=1738132 RepID=A0AAD7C7T8_9AGAR|nr:hypothetical protein FB45DRAFT_900229 [Roridomyces roridus]
MAMPYPAYGSPRPPPNDPYSSGSSYPPPNGAFNPSTASSYNKRPDDIRNISRTPSPTPSEFKALNEPMLSWKQLTNWRFWIRREWLLYYIIGGVILVLTVLISVYHDQIVDWLTPVTHEMKKLKYGWLIPIGILFVISFPPLFGHEIVAILCGIVWGLWVGFAIVCAGTFIGEVGNFYAFKYCCSARGEKMERTQINYACLAHCVRNGGIKIALIARFSAIPGHFTTAVFSTCGMGIFTFSIAAILSLPKQFVTVYLGVILDQNPDTVTLKSKLISDGVLGLTVLVTVLAMWYIFHQMALAKPEPRLPVLYESPNLNDSNSSVTTFDPRQSLSDIPLTANQAGQHPRYDYEQQQRHRQHAEWVAQQRHYNPQQPYNNPQQQQHQQWDDQGRAIGYTPGPAPQIMYAPQPQRSGRAEVLPNAYVAGDAEVYAHGRTNAVARQANQMQMRELQTRSPPSQRIQSPPRQQNAPYSSPPQQYGSPRQGYPSPQQPYPSPQFEPMGTPTQAQYASYQPQPAGGLAPATGPLPTPPYPKSPFDDPEPSHGHAVEATGDSYHTAHDHEASEVPPVQARTFSPPPPSYTTNMR